MNAIPPGLRRLFCAGSTVLRAAREFRAAAESFRGLLEVDGYSLLLAAGTAYSPLFTFAAAGDSLAGVIGRVAEHGEQREGGPITRARTREGRSVEARGRISAGEFAGRRDVVDATRTAASRSDGFTRVKHRALAGRPAPGEARRRNGPGLARVAPELHAWPRGMHSERIGLAVGTGARGHANAKSDTAATHCWTGENAARELANRADRAGLGDAWSRRAAAPPVAFGSGAAPVAGSGIAEAVAARLAPAVGTIMRRYAHAAPLGREAPPGGFVPTGQEHESAAAPLDSAATTPLRRLAALGRAAHTVPVHTAGTSIVATVRGPRAAARATSSLRERAVEPSGRELPDDAGAQRGEARDLAETLADVLYREAIRNGIDPLEYES